MHENAGLESREEVLREVQNGVKSDCKASVKRREQTMPPQPRGSVGSDSRRKSSGIAGRRMRWVETS